MAEEQGINSGAALAIGVDDKLSFGENVLYGFQHVFVLILTPIITPIIFASVFKWDVTITAYLMMIMLVGAGLETAIQCKFLKLPVAQAQAIIFIAVMIPSIIAVGPVMVWWGLVIVSAITVLLVIPFKKGILGRLLPYIAIPVVIGPLFIVIATSLIKVASIDLIFPTDYVNGGVIVSTSNIALALIAMLIPVVISFLVPKGILRYACVLWGIFIAIIVAALLGKIDFAQVASAPWFVAPKTFGKLFAGNMVFGQPRPVAFSWDFIPVILILFVAELTNILDTVGCYQGTAGLGGQKLTTERTNRGLFVETGVSLVTSFFGNIPCTSSGQNLGVLSLTRVGAKSMMIAGGIIMILIGLIFKVGVFFSVIPYAIYGGAMFIILGMLLMVGIQIIKSMEMTETNKLIVSVATIVGISFSFLPPELAKSLPLFFSFFLQNPIVAAVVVAIVMNLIFVVGLKSPGK